MPGDEDQTPAAAETPTLEAPHQPLGEDTTEELTTGLGAGRRVDPFHEVQRIVAAMAAGEEDPDAAPSEPPAEAPPEGTPEPPAEELPAPDDGLLESERIAQQEDAADRYRAEAEAERQRATELETRYAEAAKKAEIVDRLAAGESPISVLQDVGLEWSAVVRAALRTPEQTAEHRQQSEIERLRQEMQSQTKLLQEIQQERARQQDLTTAASMVRQHSDRWPSLSSHPQAADAICAEFYRGQGKESAEAIADRLEAGLTRHQEQAEWQKSPEYLAWKAKRSGGQPPAPQPTGATPPAPATKTEPRAPQTDTAPPSPMEAAGDETDPWTKLRDHLGRPPSEREVMLYVTRGVLP